MNFYIIKGTAASGKTSLIKYIAQISGQRLEEVNNSGSTTIQDYVGTFLPSASGGFIFQDGPLLRAIKYGHFFLCDEFNLASPSVLNALFPLLEGQKVFSVPDTNIKVDVHEKFRIFATQNDASYDGRYILPMSLRTRFLQIMVFDFAEAELAQIIETRLQTEIRGASPIAAQLARLYDSLRSSVNRITFREVIKMARRYHRFNPSNKSPIIPIGAIAMSYLSARQRMDQGSQALASYSNVRSVVETVSQ